MYPIINRLTQPSEFTSTKRRGKHFRCPYFDVSLIKDDHLSNSKIGFIVSNKVGKACVRNKIKRRIRDGMSRCLESDKNFKAVIVGKKKAFDSNYEEIEVFIKKACKFYQL